MDSSEAKLARERCEVHPDRQAVGLCERCGRTVCLECAIPFRGAVRCERCAAIELGETAPIVAEPPTGRRGEGWVLTLLLVAGAATIPPWHRSGTLTTVLSAWSFGLDGWAALGCTAAAAALLLAFIALVRRPAGARALALSAVLSALSAASTGVALARAPEFFSTTPGPFIALGATIAATAVAAFGLLRGARP